MNWNEPIKLASILVIVVFFVFIILLSIFPPSWVKSVNLNTGEEYIRWQMVILYSAIFSITVGICGLLISSKKRGPLEPIATKYANEQP
jgi:hypothetical protein